MFQEFKQYVQLFLRIFWLKKIVMYIVKFFFYVIFFSLFPSSMLSLFWATGTNCGFKSCTELFGFMATPFGVWYKLICCWWPLASVFNVPDTTSLGIWSFTWRSKSTWKPFEVFCKCVGGKERDGSGSSLIKLFNKSLVETGAFPVRPTWV